MSNIYITEPPPSGKVILDTSRGEIEVELFADQCPLACKNFIALALEGYYDNLVWHRYVADFIIQTGDPTGTGVGGESVYGHEFDDEPHQRLRFNRRGLLGMANGSDRNTNGSQFFLTLAATPELQNKHTMFGRISGKTIYNLIALTESVGELHPNDDRPLFPPKLKTVRVVENPFEGEIRLRITRQEKLAIQKNKREAEDRRKNKGAADPGRSRQRKKNTALLSFGEAEEVEEEGEFAAFRGPKSSHDLLKNDKRLRSETAKVPDALPKRKSKSPPALVTQPPSEPRGKEATRKEASAADDIAQLESAIRSLSKQSERDTKKQSVEKGRGKDLLASYRAQYQTAKSKRRDDDTVDVLKAFQSSLRGGKLEGQQRSDARVDDADGDALSEAREYGASDDGDGEDEDWRRHRFDAGGAMLQTDTHDTDEYVLLDPRDSASSAAIQLGFGGQGGHARAQQERARQGRRGRDWVDERNGGDRGEKRSRREDRSRYDDRQRQQSWRSR